MKTLDLHEEFLRVLHSKLPAKDIVNSVAEILKLEKDAAYRRLNGRVSFSVREMGLICDKLNISLDLLMGTKQENIYAFHLNITSEDPIQNYYESLLNINQSMVYLADDSSVYLYRAHRTLPHEFVYNYEFLSRIYTYILYYQLNPDGINPKLIKSFAELQIPEELVHAQRESTNNIQGHKSSLVLDKRIFIDYIEIVRHFYFLGLITQTDINTIKDELMSVIDDMEKCAATGLSLRGKKMDIYLCHISLDCSYSFLESTNFSASSSGVFCSNYLTSQNTKINKMQKSWIKSLMKFSSLISVSDDLKRNDFFRTQREHVETML